MALFKILHGDASNISLDITPFHEGWAYVTYDGFFYIDLNIGTVESPNNQRIKLNAQEAEKLIGYNVTTTLNNSDVEIPTSGAVFDALSQKSQVQVITSDTSEVLSTLKIHKLTQEEYDQGFTNGTLDDNALYLTPDEKIDLTPYVTIEQLNNKADIEHSHNEIYYTESEIDTKVSEINASISNSTSEAKSYASTGDASTLASAKTYTDDAVAQKSQVQIITWEADD